MNDHGARPAAPQPGQVYGAGILLVRDGHLVLTRRSATEHDPLTWACFGGMGERGETFEDCAVRETVEEAGVAVDPDRLVFVHDFHEGNGFRFVTYLADVDDGVVVVPSTESHEVGAFPLGGDEATLWANLPTPLHPGMAQLVADPVTTARVAAALRGLVTDADGPRSR